MSDLLHHALAMARHGYRIFPVYPMNPDGTCTCKKPVCKAAGKHPLLTGWPKRATTDPDHIRQFWEKWPDANPGVAPRADQVVVDCDNPAALNAYLDHAGLDTLPENTLVVASGSDKPGRYHIYHSLPPGVRLKNVATIPGMDIKTDGGFVVAPGGRHKSGRPYLARTGLNLLSPIPPALLAILRRKPSSEEPASSPTSEAPARLPAPKPVPTPKARPGARRAVTGPVDARAVKRQVWRMIERFPITGPEQRDNQVFQMVGYLLGTGRSPADVQAIGFEYLNHFEAFYSTPLADCRESLASVITRMSEKARVGEFQIVSEQDHVNRARAYGLSCWLDFIPRLLSSSPSFPASRLPAGAAAEQQDVIGEQRTAGLPPGESSSVLPVLPVLPVAGSGSSSGRAAKRYRGTTGANDQERAFLRGILSWIQYKIVDFPEEKEILLTDGQIRKLMKSWGVEVEEDGPTIRRLKEKFITTRDKPAGVFSFLIRTFKGRTVRGKGEPSRYRLAPALVAALLALPELGETEPETEEAPDGPDEAPFDAEPQFDPFEYEDPREGQEEAQPKEASDALCPQPPDQPEDPTRAWDQRHLSRLSLPAPSPLRAGDRLALGAPGGARLRPLVRARE